METILDRQLDRAKLNIVNSSTDAAKAVKKKVAKLKGAVGLDGESCSDGEGDPLSCWGVWAVGQVVTVGKVC